MLHPLKRTIIALLITTPASTTEWKTADDNISVAAMGDKVYKVMATGIGKDTRVNPDATEFVSSFRILRSKQRVNSDLPEDARKAQPAPDDTGESLVDLLSQRIGGISALILIVCMIVVVLSRLARRRESIGGDSAHPR